MAKYVCDFEHVNSIGEKICEAVGEIENAVTTYSSRIDSDLSSWTGAAKDSFTKTNSEQVDLATTDLTYVKELGEFIKNSSHSIQELEEQLAMLSI